LSVTYSRQLASLSRTNSTHRAARLAQQEGQNPRYLQENYSTLKKEVDAKYLPHIERKFSISLKQVAVDSVLYKHTSMTILAIHQCSKSVRNTV
jgi:hypothetical protein